MRDHPNARGAISARVLIYSLIGAAAVLAAYTISVDWPRQGQYTGASLIDMAGHTRLAQMRAQALVSPTPRTFVAPVPYHRPRMPNDVDALRRLADGGDAEAECRLAYRYDVGFGVARDDRTERALLLKAAAKHNGCAVNGLGNMYEHGIGVAADPSAALAYYRAAAQIGYPPAYFNLGRVYQNGWGVMPNDALALQWYLKSANDGYEPAYDEVADYYADGADRFLAEQWYALAAKSGDEYAQQGLARVYLADDRLPGHDALALQWLMKDEDSAWSDYTIGTMYQSGEGVTKSDATAAKWFERASRGHYGPAEAAYAAMLQSGLVGGKRDDAGAARYYKAAAQDGDPTGMYEFGLMTQAGVGTPRNAPLAERLFNAAAALGDAKALLLIAGRFNTGSHGYPHDRVRAQALAIVASTYGADPAEVVKLAPPRDPADPAQVERLVTLYRDQIQAMRGQAPRAPAAGMPSGPVTND